MEGLILELFDLYNRKNQPLNKTMIRGTKTLNGEYHKVVHIWIQNSKGEYLIQQRNKETDYLPFQWAPTAGAVIAGEEPFTTAIREAEEELGLKLKKDELHHLDTLFVETERSNFIIEIFKVKQDIDLQDLVLDLSEVKAVNYATENKIFELISENKFWNFIKILPDINYFDILRKE